MILRGCESRMVIRWSAAAVLITVMVAGWPAHAPAQERAPLDITPRRFGVEEPSSQKTAPAPNARIIKRYGRIEVTRISGPRYRGPGRGRNLDLGPDPWKGTSPGMARALLEALPVGAPSPTMGALIHALLTAPGPGEAGWSRPRIQLSSRFQPAQSQQSQNHDDVAFLVLRLSRLHEAGHMEDAAGLAAQVTEARGSDQAGSRIQAMAALLDNEYAEACAIGLRMRLESEDPFWVQLRAFCYLLDGAAPAALLTADILLERGVEAPLFHALTLALAGRATIPDDVWTQGPLTPLAYAMARHGGIGFPDAALGMAEPAVLRAIAMDIAPADPASEGAPSDPAAAERTPPDRTAYRQALSAAERSVLTGALEPAALAHAYRQVPYGHAALTDPLTAAASLSPPEVNALFFQVIENETIPASRIELLAEALVRAWASGAGVPAALVYGDLLEAITPDPELAWAAGDLALAAILAGQPAAAYAWRNVLSQSLGSSPDPADHERLRRLDAALAVAAPRSGANTARAGLGFGPPVLPGSLEAIEGWVRRAEAWRHDNLADTATGFHPRHVQIDLEILSALGHPLTDRAWAWLAGCHESAGAGAHASPALVGRAQDAAAKGRIGEAAALAVVMAGKHGPHDSSLTPILTAIRTLSALGLEHAARRLALETLLVRSRPQRRKDPQAASPAQPRQVSY